MKKAITKLDLLTCFAKKRQSEIKAAELVQDNILQASILIPIIDTEELPVLFTERTAHLKHHAGQISFPGGRREKIDASLKETCLRETHEEIGIAANQITILANLAPVISVTGFTVTPFVGLIESSHTLTIDPFEVASTFTVPLNFLLNPAHHEYQQYLYQGKLRDIYVIQYKQYRIWGLTAQILINLTRELEDE